MTRYQFCLLLLNLSLPCSYVHAQSGSRSEEIALDHVLQLYHSHTGDQSGIFNGSLYLRYPWKLERGHPYFHADVLVPGNVLYDKIWYTSVPLMFDEVSGDLVTKDFSGWNLVRLIRQKIERFELHGKTFVALEDRKSEASASIRFYRILHDGKSQVLHREAKFMRERIVGENVYQRYVETNGTFWLRNGAALTRIDNYKKLLNQFGTHRGQVNDYLRSQKFHFRKNPERTIVEAVRFFENLPPS